MGSRRDSDSEQFYNGLLGLPVCARFDEQGMKMTFFSLGNHHGLAIAEVTGADAPAGEQGPGQHHVAFCIGTDLNELVEAKQRWHIQERRVD